MKWFGTRKPSIPQESKDAFEQAGTSIVQMLLFFGPVNRTGLPPALSAISDLSTVRQSALAWLAWKAHKAEKKEQRMAAVEWAILVFVIVGVIVEALVFAQERRWLPP